MRRAQDEDCLMVLTKYYAADIIRVAGAIGGKLTYSPGLLGIFHVDKPEDADGLNHVEVMKHPMCEGCYLTLKQDLPWGGTDPFDSSIVVAFTRNKDQKCFVVNTWFGRPVLMPGSDWEKQGFRLESDSYGDWEEVSQCSIEGLIARLMNLERKINEKWRELKRMKIKKHQDDIREAANGFER